MALQNIVAPLKAVYDKLIALVVFLGIVASLAYLGWQAGMVREMQDHFVKEIDSMPIKHAHATPVDVADFKTGIERIGDPLQVKAAQWTNALFVPEARVWCVDCRRPIPEAAEKCPFCQAAQPAEPEQEEGRDLDRDGMKDVLELRYGLNPGNSADADEDADNDGFTNREELNANPPTNPHDPNDYPPITAKLYVTKIVPDPFKLRFKSVIRMPDGDRFAINTRGDQRTYFKKIGEEVEGFIVHSYEPKFKVVERFGNQMRIDSSVLTLKRGDKLIPLVIGLDVQYNELTAHLLLTVDNSTYEVKKGDALELKGKKYEVIDIDTRRERVVIKRDQDGKELDVLKYTGAKAGSAASAAPTDQGELPR